MRITFQYIKNLRKKEQMYTVRIVLQLAKGVVFLIFNFSQNYWATDLTLQLYICKTHSYQNKNLGLFWNLTKTGNFQPYCVLFETPQKWAK